MVKPLIKPWSGDLKTYLHATTGALISYRSRRPGKPLQLWGSGMRACCNKGMEMAKNFMEGRLNLPIDSVTEAQKRAKEAATQLLAEKFPGEPRPRRCPGQPPARQSAPTGRNSGRRSRSRGRNDSNWGSGRREHGRTGWNYQGWLWPPHPWDQACAAQMQWEEQNKYWNGFWEAVLSLWRVSKKFFL